MLLKKNYSYKTMFYKTNFLQLRHYLVLVAGVSKKTKEAGYSNTYKILRREGISSGLIRSYYSLC